VLKAFGAEDTNKLIQAERMLDELATESNFLDLGSVANEQAKAKYPFLQNFDQFTSKCVCQQALCTTCGGKVAAIQENINDKLRKEVAEFKASLQKMT
jgi:hypothetical protein